MCVNGRPLGLVYDEDGRVAFDPDRKVLEALRRVFVAFRDKGSAMQVVKWFRQENLLLPHCTRTGPSRSVLRWSLPDHPKIRRILKNPAYAGAYTYGKIRVIHQADGSVRYRTLPMEQWQVCIPDHHAGFIDWEEYRRNLEML
ncbi:MAG: recombinase family protein [Bryobacterales bacterium]|nr:recombinase family protein [Bryobacterales bacterium]